MTQTKSLSLTASVGAHAFAMGAVLVLPLLGSGPLPIVTDGDLHVPLPLPRVELSSLNPTPPPAPGAEARGGGPRGGIVAPVVRPQQPLVAPQADGLAGLIGDDPLEPWIGELDECWGACTGTGPKMPGPGGGPGISSRAAEAVTAGPGGIVSEPRRLGGAEPVYPALARATRVSGTVILECRVATNGRVEDVVVRSGHPLLDAAAVEAVRQWRYVPTLLNGTPVPVLLTVTVNFQLR